MTRLAVLARNPRKSLAALAALLVAGAVAVGSGANFTSASANPGNVFTAGTLTQSNSKLGAAILTAAGMKPGSSTTGTVTLSNTGSASGTFSLAESNATNTAGPNGGNLLGDLNLTVTDVTNASSPVQVYTGKLSGLPSTSLGTWSPSASHTYQFVVTFPDGGQPASATTGDNAYQGSSASVEFDWSATS